MASTTHFQGRPAADAATGPKPASLAVHVLAFLIPISAFIEVKVGGTLFGQDLLALVMLPFLLRERGAMRQLASIRVLFILLGVWLFGQILTDLVRQSAPQDFSRGWLKIIFFGLQIAVLRLFLSRDPKLFITYLFGTAAFVVLSIRHADASFQEQPWRFFYAPACIMIATAAGTMLMQRSPGRYALVTAALVAAAGVLNLLMASRSSFGNAEMAAFYIFVCSYIASRPRLAQSITPIKFAGFAVAGLLCSQALIGAYSQAAQAGILGPDAKLKYEQQTSGDLSLIQSGRTETLVSLQAVLDSPIIGHGSWAHDMYYVRLLHLKLFENGLETAEDLQDNEDEFDLIPTHSHLFGAWVEAGITGAVFWFFILLLCITALYKLLTRPQPLTPIAAVYAISMMWDVLFSPFGAGTRFVRAGQIVLLLYVAASRPAHSNSKKEKRRISPADGRMTSLTR